MSRMFDSICNILKAVPMGFWIGIKRNWMQQIINFDFIEVIRGFKSYQNHDELCSIALSQSDSAADHCESRNFRNALFVGSSAARLGVKSPAPLRTWVPEALNHWSEHGVFYMAYVTPSNGCPIGKIMTNHD